MAGSEPLFHNPGDVVISAGWKNPAEVAQLLEFADQLGLAHAIVGQPAKPSISLKKSFYDHDDEVKSWEEQHELSVRSEYLVAVVNPATQASLRVLTRETIRAAMGDMFGHDTSTRVSFGSLYGKVSIAIDGLRQNRAYLRHGTIAIPYREPARYPRVEHRWGITPGALYGIALEPYVPRPRTYYGPGDIIGQQTKVRLQQLLSHITGQPLPKNQSVARTDWLGYQRGIHVGTLGLAKPSE